MSLRQFTSCLWAASRRVLKWLLAQRSIMARVVLLTPTLLFLGAAAWIVTDGLNDEMRPADLGIVLSSRVLYNGQPAASLEARLDKAVELYTDGYFPEVMVSGGVGRSGYDEALVMRDYLVQKGISEEVITVDSGGYDTYQTARNAAVYMHQNDLKRAMLISQYFHLTRAKLAARRFGIAVVYGAHADYYHARRDPGSMVREILGLYAYLLRSYPALEVESSDRLTKP
jgi:vancomycin permeability regulator SanA